MGEAKVGSWGPKKDYELSHAVKPVAEGGKKSELQRHFMVMGMVNEGSQVNSKRFT